jgi:hypothetical protein
MRVANSFETPRVAEIVLFIIDCQNEVLIVNVVAGMSRNAVSQATVTISKILLVVRVSRPRFGSSSHASDVAT